MYNVCVMARMRPSNTGLNNNININSDENCIDIKENKKDLMNNKIESVKHFNFDQVYDQDYDNDDLFNDFGMKITFNLIKKIDTTFYVYGQTGSGKTYTIMGSDKVPGILPLILKVLKKQNINLTFNCIQIYNNKCLDILNNNDEIYEREDNNGKIHLTNVKHLSLKTESVTSIINMIKKNRHIGISNQNNQSSRSHLLFRINNGNNFLNILDLAGSEKAQDSIYINKDIYRENIEINKSILVLKECIRSLKNNNSHIPYRGSKLTKILKDSFERKTESYILATISSEKENISDSLNTLNYISDIKLIKRDFDIVIPEKALSPKPVAKPMAKPVANPMANPVAKPMANPVANPVVNLPNIKEVNKFKKSLSVSKLDNNENKYLPPIIKRDYSVPDKLYSKEKKNNQKYDLPPISKINDNQSIYKDLLNHRRYRRPYKDITTRNTPVGLSPNCRLLMNSRYKMDNLNREKEKIINLIARRRSSAQTKNKLVNIINDKIKLLSQLKRNFV